MARMPRMSSISGMARTTVRPPTSSVKMLAQSVGIKDESPVRDRGVRSQDTRPGGDRKGWKTKPRDERSDSRGWKLPSAGIAALIPRLRFPSLAIAPRAGILTANASIPDRRFILDPHALGQHLHRRGRRPDGRAGHAADAAHPRHPRHRLPLLQ